jgi:hypothetical protein
MVAARFGNVSLLADNAEPVEHSATDGPTYKTPCHIFDIHSRPGFSGSPVFVYRTPDSDLRSLDMKTGKRRFIFPALEKGRVMGTRSQQVDVVEVDLDNNRFLKLLGIHVSQFHDSIDIKKVSKKKPAKEADDGIIRHGSTIRSPGSMTIVVPVWQITKLITEDKVLAEKQESRVSKAKYRRDAQAVIAVAEADLAPPQSLPKADNPAHKPDFMRLLNAAAKGKRPSGRT